jgi:hypothetical protein
MLAAGTQAPTTAMCCSPADSQQDAAAVAVATTQLAPPALLLMPLQCGCTRTTTWCGMLLPLLRHPSRWCCGGCSGAMAAQGCHTPFPSPRPSLRPSPS